MVANSSLSFFFTFLFLKTIFISVIYLFFSSLFFSYLYQIVELFFLPCRGRSGKGNGASLLILSVLAIVSAFSPSVSLLVAPSPSWEALSDPVAMVWWLLCFNELIWEPVWLFPSRVWEKLMMEGLWILWTWHDTVMNKKRKNRVKKTKNKIKKYNIKDYRVTINEILIYSPLIKKKNLFTHYLNESGTIMIIMRKCFW